MALMKSLIMLAICLVKPNLGDADPCPPGFNHHEKASDKCYAVLTEPMFWAPAQEKCRTINPRAHLAVINSPLENQFISEILNDYDCVTGDGGNCFFTSGRREKENDCSSEFVWKSFPINNQPITYTNFCPGEPDCASAGFRQGCVTFAKKCYGDNSINGWQDDFCYSSFCAICELLRSQPVTHKPREVFEPWKPIH